MDSAVIELEWNRWKKHIYTGGRKCVDPITKADWRLDIDCANGTWRQ